MKNRPEIAVLTNLTSSFYDNSVGCNRNNKNGEVEAVSKQFATGHFIEFPTNKGFFKQTMQHGKIGRENLYKKLVFINEPSDYILS